MNVLKQTDPIASQSERRFQTTCWSVVVAAGRDSSPAAADALAELCRTYWQPIYAYVRSRTGQHEEARDLTQAFFTTLLDKGYAAEADPQRGRFRTFLLTACRNFLCKEWEKTGAAKRGGGRRVLSLDLDAAESSARIDPASGMTPEQHFDQQWTIALLTQIVNQLGAEMEEGGKREAFEVLKPFLLGDRSEMSYAEAGRRLGLSEAAARKAASRLRGRYRELLRREIRQTVDSPDDVEDELRSLFTALQR